MEIKTNQPTNYERLLIKKEMERQELQVRNHHLQVCNLASFHLRHPHPTEADQRVTIYVSAPWKAANDEPYLPI